MQKLWILALLLFICFPIHAQFTVSGTVTDASSQAPLPGVTIYIAQLQEGTVTDTLGNFALQEIPKGTYTIRLSLVGYETQEQPLTLNADVSLDWSLREKPTYLNEAFVYALKEYPITTSEVTREQLESRNLGQDLPALLNYETSLVYTSDAGAGVGYTGMRIRGSDAQRINVTVNGIPLNDAESHGVFWVNMPDFTSSTQSVTIQRGVGTSVNGAGAFGASVNLNTEANAEQAFVEINNSFGSFNTWRHNAQFGTGLLNEHFSVQGRLSKITSDGFVDRSAADLRSFFLSGKYQDARQSVTLNLFSGHEITQQAWWGIPEAKLNNNAEGIESYILNNGLTEAQAENLRNSDSRTYNHYIYDNEVDNYQQDHYQLLHEARLNPQWKSNTAFHYTRGRGFFEQAIYNGALAAVGLEPIELGETTVTSSDYVVRRWLDNHFYGFVQSFTYQSKAKRQGQAVLDFVAGGGWNFYDGEHFGELVWSQFAGNAEVNQRYYDGTGKKRDWNIYAKANVQPLPGLFLFADLQVRSINYEISGTDNTLRDVSQTDDFLFFNPKAGVSYFWGNNRVYGTFAIANKEPIRSDYTDAPQGEVPTHETLRNVEIGYSKTYEKARLAVNYYWMGYKNQLIPTGQVNDVGAAIRTNIPKSYRTGVEIEGQWDLSPQWSLVGNATWSQNKNVDFTEYIIDYADFTYITNELGNTDIAFSPEWIAGGQVHYRPMRGVQLAILSKYVSEQFLDNTQNADRTIPSYFVSDLNATYQFSIGFLKDVTLSLLINNLFDEAYETNGYTYAYAFGQTTIREDHFYPQAGRNFLLGLKIRI